MKRWDVLKKLLEYKKPKTGAEIGCLGGTMSAEVLKRFPSIEIYYAIDSWEWYNDYQKSLRPNAGYIKKFKNNPNGFKTTFRNFQKNIEPWKEKVKVLRMFSNEAHVHIPDESLDFCFIDANHAYEYVKEDIINYLPKMKKGGLFGGHDYGHKVGGVKEAVHEMFDNKDIILDKNLTWWVWI